ncbi:hypothetical protein SISNIDRAFT_483715 [Sistotremastrum niveocremeum HHB9708]|uniref:ABM domain-containing protein n=1 Tax=Sistotremastrum niveocremeum HHB9708 TaxID=1314777 RepID=A0A164WYL1_9AGAM|nr:hypothetical protein SISNIDRAFT_483715 [Sistotremastrum niveocremeum HHB9708]
MSTPAGNWIKVFLLDLTESTKFNPTLFEDVVDLVHERREQWGIRKQYYGVSYADAGKLYWAIEYEGPIPGLDTSVVNALKTHAIGEYTTLTLNLRASASPSLNAPITEFAILPVKPDANHAAFASGADDLVVAGLKYPRCHSVTWGWTEEDSNEAVLVAGWNSMAAFLEFTATPEFRTYAGPLISMMNERSVGHVVLKSKQ